MCHILTECDNARQWDVPLDLPVYPDSDEHFLLMLKCVEANTDTSMVVEDKQSSLLGSCLHW